MCSTVSARARARVNRRTQRTQNRLSNASRRIECHSGSRSDGQSVSHTDGRTKTFSKVVVASVHVCVDCCGSQLHPAHGATRIEKKKKIPFEGMKQPRTVDHLARGSMKTAANCASSCNPQVMRTSTSRTHIAALVTKESWATPV